VPSVQHQFLARAVPRIRRSSEVDDPAQVWREKLAEQAKASTAPPHRLVHGCEVATIDGYGFPVHDLRVAGTVPTRTLLYLHGGGYVSHADRAHWKYVVTLAQQLGLRVVFPVYPLAPEHSWRDSHPQLLALFAQVAIESPHGVVLAGDSAGGGLALGVAEQLARRAGPQPTHVVLHSPWVDLTNAAPGTEAASVRDPWLKLSRMRLYAEWWAAGEDQTRPELSPLYGDLTGLPPTLMFCGTLDTLYPQCRELADRGRTQGWDLTYVEQPDLLHVYPILPVPEAKQAMATTVAFLAQTPERSR
jgi:acetyl esterase/lipase